MDRATGALTQLQVFDDIRNPSWLAFNPAQTRLYAVSEIDNFQGTRSGAWSRMPSTARVCRSGDGRRDFGRQHPDPCQRASVRPVRIRRNYGGGNVAVFPVGADGALGEPSDVRPSVGPRHRAACGGRSAGAIRSQRS